MRTAAWRVGWRVGRRNLTERSAGGTLSGGDGHGGQDFHCGVFRSSLRAAGRQLGSRRACREQGAVLSSFLSFNRAGLFPEGSQIEKTCTVTQRCIMIGSKEHKRPLHPCAGRGTPKVFANLSADTHKRWK